MEETTITTSDGQTNTGKPMTSEEVEEALRFFCAVTGRVFNDLEQQRERSPQEMQALQKQIDEVWERERPIREAARQARLQAKR